MQKYRIGQFIGAIGVGINMAGTTIALKSNQSIHSSDPHTVSGLAIWLSMPLFLIAIWMMCGGEGRIRSGNRGPLDLQSRGPVLALVVPFVHVAATQRF